MNIEEVREIKLLKEIIDFLEKKNESIIITPSDSDFLKSILNLIENKNN